MATRSYNNPLSILLTLSFGGDARPVRAGLTVENGLWTRLDEQK